LRSVAGPQVEELLRSDYEKTDFYLLKRSLQGNRDVLASSRRGLPF